MCLPHVSSTGCGRLHAETVAWMAAPSAVEWQWLQGGVNAVLVLHAVLHHLQLRECHKM